MRSKLASCALLLLAACNGGGGGSDTRLERFNSEDDVVEVEVIDGPASDDSVTVDLTSTTGQRVVGTLTVTPAAGPVGTVHTIEVLLLDVFEDRVDVVDVVADAGDRGARSIPLTPDSADGAVWVVDVRSFGAEGEERTDTFTARLFERVPNEE